MNNNYSKLLAAVGILALFALVPFTGTAQTTSPYGSKVAFGDNDFVPTLAASGDPDAGAGGAAGGALFCRVALGDTSLITDDGYYLLPYVTAPAAVAATLPVNSVRITTVLGKAPGTQVADADTSEKGQACVAGTGISTVAGAALAAAGLIDVFFLNFDAVVGYTSGDCVYLDADNSGTLTRWDVRLTGCTVGTASYNAGTLVELGEQDLVNGVAGATAFAAGARFAVWDSQPNGGGAGSLVDSGDRAYLQQAVVAQPGLNNVRLFGGTYGGKVAVGGGDFLVTTAAFAPAATFCHVNLGDTSLLTDDGYYVMPAAAATATLVVNSVRLNTIGGKAPGTQVADADVSEKGQLCMNPAGAAAQTSQVLVYAFGALAPASADYEVFGASFDSIATYTSGDCVYVNRDQTDNGVVAPGNLPTLTRWDVRLTECKVGTTTYNAGTLVELGDADLVNNPGAISMGAAAAAVFYDSQPNGVVDSGDRAYHAVGGAGNPGTNDLRVLGGGTYGAKVTIGKDDFVPTLAGLPVAGLNFCRVPLGDTSLVTDDGYYFVPGAAGQATVLVNSVRLTTVLGKNPGTLVGDSDVSEKGQACADPDAALGTADGSDPIGFAVPAVNVPNVFALSFDAIAPYSSGDCVYLDSAASGVFGAVSRWDVRLTKCVVGTTTYNAGTLVELGDMDLVNAPAAIVGPTVARFWDAQPNGVFDGADRLYLAVAAIARPGLNDVRVIGDFTVATNPGGGPPSSTTATTTTTTTTSAAVTTTTTTTTTSAMPTTTTTTSPAGQQTTTTGGGQQQTTTTTTGPTTPGFELVALVAALGAALVLVRRKL